MFFARPSSLLQSFSRFLSFRLSRRQDRLTGMIKTIKATQASQASRRIETTRAPVVARRTVDAGVAIIGGSSTGSVVEMVLCHGYDTIPDHVRELPEAAN